MALPVTAPINEKLSQTNVRTKKIYTYIYICSSSFFKSCEILSVLWLDEIYFSFYPVKYADKEEGHFIN